MKDPKKVLADSGLKVTPQRIAVLNALRELRDHPTADRIIDRVKMINPSIAGGTVYRTLESLVKRGVIHKVKTERDVIRFDDVTAPHHHYYCSDTEEILDYFDEDLNQYLKEYFKSKCLPGFEIDDIRVQVSGRKTGVSDLAESDH